jgi:ferric-dicitrate binding protein FerR (iron transport regulator)
MASRLTPYVEELLDNRYAQANLREGADKLREAYQRSKKRRVEPARDAKIHKQLEAAMGSIGEGAKALASRRRKPVKRRGRRLALLAGVAALAAGVALAANDSLRSSLLGPGTPEYDKNGSPA